MHDHVHHAHLDAMAELAAALPALPADARQFVARLLKIDVDVLSAAAVDAAIAEAALAKAGHGDRDQVRSLHVLLANVIKSKIEMLGPLAFDDPSPAAR